MLLSDITLDNGYVNMERIISLPVPFIFIIGGRGTGKTYGVLKHVHDHPEEGTIFLRISDKEHSLISDPEFMPFSWHNQDFGWNVQPFKKNKDFTEWYQAEIDDDGKYQPSGPRIMMSTSLLALCDVRGFNGSFCNFIVFDEFIPKKKSRKRMADDDFKDAYETVNRNRELNGEPPVKCILCSNSSQVDNPIMRSFNLTDIAVRMKKRQQMFYMNSARGIAIYILPETRIGAMKRQTALYAAGDGDDEYSKMALENEFSYDKPSQIESLDMKGMKAVFFFSEKVACYRTLENGYYVTDFVKKAINVPTYLDTPPDILNLRRSHMRVWDAYLKGRVTFERYTLEIEFRKLYLDSVW